MAEPTMCPRCMETFDGLEPLYAHFAETKHVIVLQTIEAMFEAAFSDKAQSAGKEET